MQAHVLGGVDRLSPAMIPSPAPLLELARVEKRYGGVHALRGVHATLRSPGVVHALMGENGSGKSTLLGVLSGQVAPDGGTIAVDGKVVRFASPVDALESGIAMVSQETAVAADLSVAENILLGRRLVGGLGRISWRKSHAVAEKVLDRLGLAYDPRALVRDLAPDQRQMVEIARALSMDARILILDEPTSHFTDDEVSALFKAIRALREDGIAIIFVSHRLREIYEIADEVTILRDGRTVSSGVIGDYEPERMVAEMVGEAAEEHDSRPSGRRAHQSAEALLEVRGLTSSTILQEVDLSVARGEIVGLAGLVGAGRSELLRAIFGVEPIDVGTVHVSGRLLVGGNPRRAIEAGIGYVPPDRRRAGVMLEMSINDNLMMVSGLSRYRLAKPRSVQERDDARRVMRQVRVRAASPNASVGTLSGGNQQKVALGKWLVQRPKLLLLDEPTRGVDVMAKKDIHQLLKAAAAEGLSLLVSSSESEELLELCDRVIVMFRGKVAATLAADEASEAILAQLEAGRT